MSLDELLKAANELDEPGLDRFVLEPIVYQGLPIIVKAAQK
jgi:hypothetical protein